MDRHEQKKARPWDRESRSSSSSSSSSSSDESSFSLPSVKLLASKFSSLDKKGTAPTPLQPKAQQASTTNKIIGGGQRIITTSPATKPAYSTNKPNYSSLPAKPKQQVMTNGRSPSYNDQDDDVFYNDVPKKQNAPSIKSPLRKTSSSSNAESESSTVALGSSQKLYQQQRPQVQEKQHRESTEVFPSNRSSISSVSADSPKHNFIFGVPLRRLDTISWGVKQKRIASNERSDSISSSDDSRSPTPSPSPAPLDSESKFSTFPKRTQLSAEYDSHKANTLGKRGGGGVKSKIALKMGDKSSPMYHSQSNISTAAVAAGLNAWRRKSVSDDTYQFQHQSLTRRQSISDLLKLYRTKSQSDLSQIVDGGPSLPKTLQSQKEEPQTKPKVVAPLKMSDLQIVNPMAKPKVEPYKSATKDIVRLPTNRHSPVTKSQSVPGFSAQTQVNNRQVLSSTSSTSDSESDRSKVISPPPQQRPKSVQYISRPQHFNRPQVLTKPGSSPAKPSVIAVKPIKPTSATANKPTLNVPHPSKPVIISSFKLTPSASNELEAKEAKPALSLKPVPPQKTNNTMKLTRMLTPPSYPGYSEPNFPRNQSASTRSSSSSSSSSSDSENEIPRKLQESISKQTTTDPVRNNSPVSTIISSLNKTTGQPVYPPKNTLVTKPRTTSWKTYDNNDEADGIPHDDKTPSFIVPPQPKKNAIVITKINSEKAITTNKTPWKPKNQHVPQNKLVPDDTDGIPHDEKVPSFVVTKPAQNVAMNRFHRFETNKEPPVKSSSISPLTKSWPPENKARTNSSSSDSTIKDLGDGHNSSKVSVISSHQNYKEPKPSSPSSSDSDSSGDEKPKKALNVKTGFYEVNKEISPDVADKKKMTVRITRKSSSSDSAEDERKKANLVKIGSQMVKQTKFSILSHDDDRQQPKTSNIPKPTVTSVTPKKPFLTGDSLTAVINIRPEPIKTSRKSSSSSDDTASPKATKIPTYKIFNRKESSTSDEDIKVKVKEISKHLDSPKLSQTTSSTKEVAAKNDKLDRNADERRSNSSASAGEQFEGFDPYAISRMIVRGSRKRDSHVKKPEHLTNIMNATIPVHSPFSPLKAANAKKAEADAPIKEEIVTRRTSTSSSSSSSSSNDGLGFLDDVEQDGVFSANFVNIE